MPKSFALLLLGLSAVTPCTTGAQSLGPRVLITGYSAGKPSLSWYLAPEIIEALTQLADGKRLSVVRRLDIQDAVESTEWVDFVDADYSALAGVLRGAAVVDVRVDSAADGFTVALVLYRPKPPGRHTELLRFHAGSRRDVTTIAARFLADEPVLRVVDASRAPLSARKASSRMPRLLVTGYRDQFPSVSWRIARSVRDTMRVLADSKRLCVVSHKVIEDAEESGGNDPFGDGTYSQLARILGAHALVDVRVDSAAEGFTVSLVRYAPSPPGEHTELVHFRTDTRQRVIDLATRYLLHEPTIQVRPTSARRAPSCSP